MFSLQTVENAVKLQLTDADKDKKIAQQTTKLQLIFSKDAIAVFIMHRKSLYVFYARDKLFIKMSYK